MKFALRFAAAFLLLAATGFSQDYDILIRNGRVVDGSGNPWVYADVGIVGDRIVFVGQAGADVKAKRTIDATGLVVAPGFIDMLGQSETSLLIDNRAVSKLTQGVTTEITGEGWSIAPTNEEIVREDRDFYEHFHLKVDWSTLGEYFQRLERQGTAINLGTYVGATQVRKVVVGGDNRPPTADELKRMEMLVDDAMWDGALGVSSALIYAPGNYASTDELIALAKVAGRNGGIYASHIRSESDSQAAALEEAFRIGREAKLPVEIFHLKVSGQKNWGKMPQVIAAIEKARAEGLDVTADQYPYMAGAAPLSASIPPEFHAGGTDAFLARLRDPQQRQAIRKAITSPPPGATENLWIESGGASGVLVLSVINPELKKYQGKRISEIATAENRDPIDVLMDLVLAGHDSVTVAYFLMNEDDVKLALQQPWVSVGTDHDEVAPDGPLSQSNAHPRGYGSYTRILGKYVREQHLLPLEAAIRKFTSLAAQRVRLDHRGLLKPDYFADVTIFDPAKVNDVSTYENSHRPSVGIEYVLVNGVIALDGGKVTGAKGGRGLRGQAYWAHAGYAEGQPPRGGVRGFITDAEGWPLPRTAVSVVDAAGKQLATVTTKKDGRYAVLLEQPCAPCKVVAERMGFRTQSRAVDYNGANSLYFSFTLEREK